MNRSARRVSKYPHDVYRAYKGDALIYVGISVNVFKRLGQHRLYARWYWEADRIDVVRRPNRSAARAEEARTIRECAPVYNVTPENAYGCVESTEALEEFSMWRDDEGRWWIDDEG